MNKNTLKITELKNLLSKLPTDELIKLIVESYKISKEVQALLNIKLKGDEGLTAETAEEKWLKLSKTLRDKTLENVWCVNCMGVVTMIDYHIDDDNYGVILKGKCKICGQDVTRVVEIEK